MTTLFRNQVLEKQKQKLLGDVILAAPVSYQMIIGLLVLLTAGLVMFAILGEYSRKERVTGYLTPDKGVIRIVPTKSGLIENVDVEIGQKVKKGEKLFLIRTDNASSKEYQSTSVFLEQLRVEKMELNHRRDLIPEQYRLMRHRIMDQVSAARSESVRLTERIMLQENVVKNEFAVLEKYQQLGKSEAASELEVSNQENQYLQAKQLVASLRNESDRFLDSAKDLEAEYSLLPVTEQQEISEITGRLISLDQRIAQNQESYLITAPISGRISSLNAKGGQIADVQRTLATIIPVGGKLDAELFVPSRAAGFVKEGQSVRLLYEAFPYQKFGFYGGTVSKVSRTVIIPTDQQYTSNTQEPVFVITVSLDSQSVDTNNEISELQSGMTLAADIVLEDRKIWEWVFEPILGSAKK